MIIVNRFIVKFVTFGFAGAFAFWPFVFVYNAHCKTNPTLLNHEKIHLRQQLELLVIPFYIWYFTEYLIRLVYYRNRYKAYRTICFEQEAYDNDQNLEYLRNRKMYAFFKKNYFYFSKKQKKR